MYLCLNRRHRNWINSAAHSRRNPLRVQRCRYMSVTRPAFRTLVPSHATVRGFGLSSGSGSGSGAARSGDMACSSLACSATSSGCCRTTSALCTGGSISSTFMCTFPRAWRASLASALSNHNQSHLEACWGLRLSYFSAWCAVISCRSFFRADLARVMVSAAWEPTERSRSGTKPRATRCCFMGREAPARSQRRAWPRGDRRQSALMRLSGARLSWRAA